MPLRSLRLLRPVGLLLCFAFGCERLTVAEPSDRAPSTVVAIHQQLVTRGAGKTVKLVRADGSEVRGRIVAVRDDAVDLQRRKTATPMTIPLADVRSVKGPGLSTGAKVGIGIGVGALITAGVVALVARHQLDGLGGFHVPSGPL